MNKQETQTAICINDKTERDKRIKTLGITEGKEYPVKLCRYPNYYELVNDLGNVETYFMDRFEIIKTPGEKMQDFHKNNKTWFQQAMENVQPKVKEQLQKAINNYFEGDKMEDKTIKVRCIGDVLDFTIGNAYIGTRTESGGYLIVDDLGEEDFYYKSDFKGLFEIIEDVLMVECVDSNEFEGDLSKGEKYKVIEDSGVNLKVKNDRGYVQWYRKNRFKPVDPQKEIKEYSVMELLDFPVGTKFYADLSSCNTNNTTVEVKENENKRKAIICKDIDEENQTIEFTEIWAKAKYTLIEEPKPVTTAEAFKALEEGNIIESLVSENKYKKENGIIYMKNLEIYARANLICGLELEGKWIIHE